MGRTLKHVPLDFSWPIDKTWKGYINPFADQRIKCPHCDGDGANLETRILSSLWYLHSTYTTVRLAAQTSNEELKLFVNSILNKRCLGRMFFNWAKEGVSEFILDKLEPLRNIIFPSETHMLIEMSKVLSNEEMGSLAQYVNECTPIGWGDDLEEEEIHALIKRGRLSDLFPGNKWYKFIEEEDTWKVMDLSVERDKREWIPCEAPQIPSAEEVNKKIRETPMGHDSINHWIAVQSKAERLGIHGNCESCDGQGYTWPSEEIKESCENWEKFEPPLGDGFQLWETTSEGSPMTPVFKTLDDLCEYAEENCGTFAGIKTSKENWKKMLEEDNVHTIMESSDGEQRAIIL